MTASPNENLYHRILNLSKDVTAPDAYQLLGLKRFESDPKIIKKAAMDRTGLLQVMQNAENYDEVKRLEREVGEAMVCLSNPQRKAEYDQSLREAVPSMEPPPPPPKPAAPVTMALANSAEPTVEVKILPPTPPKAPEKPASPVPKTGIRFLPPPTGGKKKEQSAERKEPKDAQKFLPGEVPWQFGEHWWQRHPELAKRAAIGAGAFLFLILVISFWPSSSADETVAENEVQTTPNSSQQTAAVSKVIQPANVGSLTSEVLLRNPSGTLEDFAMAPDASWIVTLGGNGLIHLWEESTGATRELNAQGLGGMGGISGGQATHIAATPDGGHLFAATAMGQLQEWPISASTPGPGFLGSPVHESPHFKSGIRELLATSDGQRIVGLNADSEMFVFDRGSSQTTARLFAYETFKPLNVLTARPGAETVAFGCLDQAIVTWNPSQPQSPLEVIVQGKSEKPDLALAYSRDGTRLAAVGADHQIRLMDPANPNADPIVCKSHTGRVYALSFSQEGTLLISVGADRAARLWDTSTGTELATLGGHARPIIAVQFASDGESFLTASQEGIVRKWSARETVSEPLPILPAELATRSSNPNLLAESTSSRFAVSRQFQMTNADSEPFQTYSTPLAWAAISPDGSLALGPIGQGKVAIYDTKTSRPKHVLPISAQNQGSVEFSSDGQTLIAVESDGWLSSWDIATGRLLDRMAYPPGDSRPQRMAVSTTGQRLAIPNPQNEVEFRTQYENLSAIADRLELPQTCYQLAITTDGRFLAANMGAAVDVWDLGDPSSSLNVQLLNSLPLTVSSVQRAFTLSPNGEMCAVGTDDGKIQVFATRTGKELASFTGHPNGPVKGLAFDSQGSLLFSAGNESGVRVWSAKTWSLAAWLSSQSSQGAMSPARIMPVPGAGYGPGFGGTNAPPIKLHITADGKQLIVVDQAGQGVVWEVGQADNPGILADFTLADLSVGGSAQTLTSKNFAAISKWSESPAHLQRVTHLDYSPDGKMLLTAGSDGIVRVWNAQTGSLQRQILLPPPPAVNGLPGGNPLGVVPGFGEVPDVIGPPTGEVGSAGGLRHWAISSGNLLATSMDGRLIQLWDIATGVNRGKIGDPKEDHVWFGFAFDGKTFFTLLNTGLLKSWNFADLSLAKSTSLRTGTAFASAPAGSGVLFALGDADGAVWLVKTDFTSTALGGNRFSHSVRQLQFSRDGKLLAALDAAGSIRVWEMASRTEILRFRRVRPASLRHGVHSRWESPPHVVPNGNAGIIERGPHESHGRSKPARSHWSPESAGDRP